jgi:L-threonylcarbamoyladenylate synthase
MGTFFSEHRPDAVDAAVEALNRGGVTLLPADTVYGFFGRADVKESTERVYEIKQRDRGKPFGIYTNERKVERWVTVNQNARLLMETFWPAPLTLILPRTDAVPEWFTGIETVGVLTAKNPLISEVVERVDGPIFGTTVNYSGEPSIIRAADARHFLDHVDVMIGDDNVIIYNESSTIVDCTITPPAVIREGVVSTAAIREVIEGLQIDFSRRR